MSLPATHRTCQQQIARLSVACWDIVALAAALGGVLSYEGGIERGADVQVC